MHVIFFCIGDAFQPCAHNINFMINTVAFLRMEERDVVSCQRNSLFSRAYASVAFWRAYASVLHHHRVIVSKDRYVFKKESSPLIEELPVYRKLCRLVLPVGHLILDSSYNQLLGIEGLYLEKGIPDHPDVVFFETLRSTKSKTEEDIKMLEDE